jgi:vancomycin resistance protein YoaR
MSRRLKIPKVNLNINTQRLSNKPRPVIFMLLAAAVFVIGAYIFQFEQKHADLFYPGISLGGEPFGGKTYSAALDHFSKRAADIDRAGLNLVFKGEGGEQKIIVQSSANGLTPDTVVTYFSIGNWKESLDEAYGWGRAGSPLQRAREQISLIFADKNFNFPAMIRQEAVISIVSKELKNFLPPTTPAQFVLSGSKILIADEKIGEKVNMEEVINLINKSLLSLESTPLIFEASPKIPLATLETLSPFLELANEIAKKTNLIFRYKGHSWKVSGKKLATWLTITDKDQIGIDKNKLDNLFSKTVIPFIDNPPQNSRFEILNGKLAEISPGKTGSVVDIDKTIQKVELIIPTAKRSLITKGNLSALAALSAINFNVQTGTIEVPIETKEVEPKITRGTIDEYGIRDLIGTARTDFTGGSLDRQHNIEVGVSKLNGLLIAPGEEFSTLASIGTTTKEAGFVEEYVIKENKTVKELGGGLCQVATTLFRLALSAGLPITQRVNHRFVISYYGPGLDATIYDPYTDFRFVNDTDSYILIQGKTKNNEVILEFYGQKDGRQVEISEPKLSDEIPAPDTKYITSEEVRLGQLKCSEVPRKGVTADVVYTVRHTGGKIVEQDFHSIYQPWQKICLVGTGTGTSTPSVAQ